MPRNSSSRLRNIPFLKFKNTLTDGGPEWQDEFDKLLNQRGISHYYIYPQTPKQNPVVERSIKTDLKEFSQWGNNSIPDLKEQNQKLKEKKWNEISQDIPLHQAFGNLIPNEYYQKCCQKLIIIKPFFIKCLPDLSSVDHGPWIGPVQ